MRSSLLLLLLLPAVLHAQVPPRVLTSAHPEALGQFGAAVSGVPDADGDGLGDLVVGAHNEDELAMANAGRVYLFSGATGELLAALISPNKEVDGHFGRAVAGVPDADGDGRGDFAVGAYNEDTDLDPDNFDNQGRAYLFSGATGTLLHVLTSPKEEPGGGFGWAVAGVPDADGDGRGDVLVSTPFEDGRASADVGRAYLFSGATGELLRVLISPNPEAMGQFGYAASGVPDADGDGRGDLLVGANKEGGALNAGRAHLFSGATGALLQTVATPHNQGREFGFSVAGVPDASGDGRGDLLIGSGEFVGGRQFAGRAYVFSGGTGALLHTLTSPDPETYGQFGLAVSGVADADGDGRGDLLIGAYGEDGGLAFIGRAYLFSGATGARLRTLTTPNPEANGVFGYAVSGVPDADGDGRGDLLVGAYGEDGETPDDGRAYFFPSNAGVNVTASGDPTTIPPGGTVTVTATVANTTAQPIPLDLWVVVARNGNVVVTRLIGSGTLPAGATVTRAFPLTAPGTTPPGPYTVNVNAGTFPGTVLAADAFGVTVTPSLRRSEPSTAEPFVVAPLAGDVFAADAPASSAGFPTPSVSVSPNPFSGQAVLRFTLTEAAPVRLTLYDVLGREVALLLDGALAAGPHEVAFAARGLPSGVYVWRLEAGGAVQTGRLTLLE
jgi:hypothetical protein